VTQTEAVSPPALIRAVREFHGLSQEGFGLCLFACRRTVIRWEKRGTAFSAWTWNARGRNWTELLARYQAAESLRVTPGDWNDRRQVRASEIVRELGASVVTRVEWKHGKNSRRAALAARSKTKAKKKSRGRK
jgi:hypothetical protein